MTNDNTRQRLFDIDTAKGLAILLVVYGHLIADAFPKGNDWYQISNEFVYLFHMPFFMYLSGYIFFYTYKPVDSLSNYLQYGRKKFVRIAPSYFLFAFIILAGKFVASKFLHVDNVPDSFSYELSAIIPRPGASAASSLWYVYVLVELLLIFPILLYITRSNHLLIVILSISLYFWDPTDLFLLNKVFEFLVFFAIGVISVSHQKSYLSWIDRYTVPLLILFLASFAITEFIGDKEANKLIVGLLSIPALHGLVRTSAFRRNKVLTYLGALSFAIYLMNTIFIGLAKGVTLKYIDWNGENFLIVAPILFIAGLIGPIITKEVVLKRIPFLDRLTS